MCMDAGLTAEAQIELYEAFEPTLSIAKWYEEEEQDQSEDNESDKCDISCQEKSYQSVWKLSDTEETDESFWEISAESEPRLADLQQERQPFIEKLRTDLHNLTGTDMEIIVNKREFKCHSIVLNTFSKYFCALPKNQAKSLVLPKEHVSEVAFATIYKWLLFNNRTYEGDTILELLRAAQFLQIHELVASCWACLDNRRNYNEFDAFLLYEDARHVRMSDVQSMMLTRFSYCFLSLLTQIEFYDLNADDVCKVIGSNNLGVQSESEVFYAVVLWVNHDFEKRLAYVPQLMSHVRFAFMSQYFLLRLSVCKVCKAVRRCLIPAVRAMIRKAMCYLVQSQYQYNKHVLYEQPIERLWVQDPCCRYLQLIKGSGIAAFTLEMFIKYLCDIKDANYDTHYKTLVRNECSIEYDSDESDWSSLPFFNSSSLSCETKL